MGCGPATVIEGQMLPPREAGVELFAGHAALFLGSRCGSGSGAHSVPNELPYFSRSSFMLSANSTASGSLSWKQRPSHERRPQPEHSCVMIVRLVLWRVRLRRHWYMPSRLGP